MVKFQPVSFFPCRPLFQGATPSYQNHPPDGNEVICMIHAGALNRLLLKYHHTHGTGRPPKKKLRIHILMKNHPKADTILSCPGFLAGSYLDSPERTSAPRSDGTMSGLKIFQCSKLVSVWRCLQRNDMVHISISA